MGYSDPPGLNMMTEDILFGKSPEFTAFILPHLSMPKHGPKCKLGYCRIFNLILWVLSTGMQWKCLPVPQDPDGTSAIHYTTVYKVFLRRNN